MIEVSIKSNLVDVPGGRIFTRLWTPDTPTASSSPLILLHDSLGCVELWRDFPKVLARGLRHPILAYDRLGFGKSSARSGLPSLDFIREEATVFFPAILEALNIDRCSLFGHSVGGAMALMIAALQKRENILSVTTESAQAFVEQRTLSGIRTAQKQFNQAEHFNKLTKWHGTKAQWVLDAWTEIWLSPTFASWSLDPYLARVHCPVLAIHGDLDEYGSTEFPRRIVRGVEGPAMVEILKGCGHVPHREQPGRVLQLLDSFLT